MFICPPHALPSRLAVFAVFAARTALPIASFATALCLGLARPAPAHAALGTSCNTDAECDDDEACQITSVSGSAGCPSDSECQPEEPQYDRSCVAKQRTCQNDTDCPFPSVCADAGDDGVTSSDGVTETTTTPSKVCTWKVTKCEADSECGDTRFSCVEFGRYDTCGVTLDDDAPPPMDSSEGATSTSGSGAGGTTRSSGTTRDSSGESMGGGTSPQGTPKTEPDTPGGDDIQRSTPEDRACDTSETVIIKGCFPKLNACSQDGQCETGWSCVDTAELDDAPFVDTNASGGVCLPDGIKLAISGRVAVDGEAVLGPVRGDIALDEDDARAAGASPPLAGNNSNESGQGSGGGCAVAPGISSGMNDAAAPLSLLLVAFAAVLFRRRR